jgi:hypothetical protein
MTLVFATLYRIFMSHIKDSELIKQRKAIEVF